VAVISATNKDPNEEIKAGVFREDLFYRLGKKIVEVPPLRERKPDIPVIATSLLKKLRTRAGESDPYFRAQEFAPRALERLEHHEGSWPGNIRQLENVVRDAYEEAGEERAIRVEHLPPEDTWDKYTRAVDRIGLPEEIAVRPAQADSPVLPKEELQALPGVAERNMDGLRKLFLEELGKLKFEKVRELWVRALMKRYGENYKKCGEIANLDRGTLSRWEKGGKALRGKDALLDPDDFGTSLWTTHSGGGR
jgi:transcriptional regulator with PAS, ATPase and Fis domain